MKTLLTVALCLLAVPVLAAQPAPTQAPATPGAPAFVAALMPAPLAEATTSVCTANCWDGSTVTCSGTTCTAVDSACSSGQNGYCYGSDTDLRSCPTCSTHQICKPSCDDLNGQSCASAGTCYDSTCRAYTCPCRNGHYLCP